VFAPAGWFERINGVMTDLAYPRGKPDPSVAVVAIEEMVVHGWDLARAIDRPYESTPAELAVLDDFFGQFGPDQRGDAYGPERPAGPGATPLDHAIARSGRDPAWTATR